MLHRKNVTYFGCLLSSTYALALATSRRTQPSPAQSGGDGAFALSRVRRDRATVRAGASGELGVRNPIWVTLHGTIRATEVRQNPP